MGVRRRDPPEMMLLGLCLISGLSFVAGAAAPTSIEAVMPGWLVVAWYVALLVAGVVGLVGNAWPGNIGTGLLIRLSGQVLAVGPAAAYSIAALVFAGPPAFFPAAITLAFALICLWTARHLAEDLRILRGISR
jgi:hypothetical protein